MDRVYDSLISKRIASLFPAIFVLSLYLFFSLYFSASFSGPYITDEFVFIEWTRDFLAGNPNVHHTVGYTAYLSTISLLITPNPTVFRLATFALSIGTIIMIASISQSLLKTNTADSFIPGWTENENQFVVLCTLLFATAPMAIQTSVLIDMENAAAFGTITFFAWFMRSFEEQSISQLNRFIGTSVILLSLMWTKLGMIPAIFGASVAYLFIQGKHRQLLEMIIATGVAVTLFIITWFAFTNFYDVSFLEPFLNNIRKSNFNPNHLFANLVPKRRAVLAQVKWLTPPLLLLGFAAVIPRSTTQLRKQIQNMGVSVLFALFIGITFYQYSVFGKVPYGFPKYVGRTMPILAVLSGITIAKMMTPVTSGREVIRLTFLISLLGVIIYVLPDGIRTPEIQYGLAGVAIISVGLMIPSWVFKIRPSPWLNCENVIKILFVIVLALNLGTVATQATAEYNTGYHYGNTGFVETAEYVQTNYDTSEQTIATFLDMGYATRPDQDEWRWYWREQKTYVQLRSNPQPVEREKPELVVIRDHRTTVIQWLKTSDEYDHEVSYGDWLIFQHK